VKKKTVKKPAAAKAKRVAKPVSKTDFTAHLERARRLAHVLGDQADTEEDQKRKVGLSRQYREMMEQVRRLELSAPKILLEQGKVIDRAKVEKEIGEAATMARNELLGLPAKLAPTLVGKTAGEIMTLMRSEIIAALRHLAGLDAGK
jgi:hypothetical protein